MSRFAAIFLAALFTCPASQAIAQSRVDFHLLPAVSSGPLDPDWSPDMQSLVFAARGDIWRVPVQGGSALALTTGPDYYSEPAFSPDGLRVAMTAMRGNDLELALVDAVSGPIERVVDGEDQDFSPQWSPDGKGLYFVRRSEGSLDIMYVDLATREVTEFIGGPGNQYQPAISPDGTMMAYVATVENRLGSGGIWVRALSGGDARLVHYEESSYRMKPGWSRDGNVIVYVSDAAGSNDIAAVALDGGNRVRLTESVDDEFDPAVSPDGAKIAFVSNDSGPTRLNIISADGEGNSRTEIGIDSLWPQTPTGMVRGRIVNEDGETIAARLMLTASDGRSYAEHDGFHRVVPATGTHYQHSDGTFAIEVPVGATTIEAMHGFEFSPVSVTVDVKKGGIVDTELKLRRIDDPSARGWYSGDMHVHDLHEGRFGLSHEMFMRQLVADDVGVANSLIHMDGTKIMGRWSDLSGTPHPLSGDTTILRYSQEFRGYFGHIALVGVDQFVMPMIAGTPNTPFAADDLGIRHAAAVHSQGGIAGFVHPYNHTVTTAQDAGRSAIPVVAAIAGVDFYDVASSASLEADSSLVYYKLLNSGIRLAATGGTDNFSDVWFDPSGGATRTYAYTGAEGKLNYDDWLSAVAAGKTFATSGPLLFLDINGRIPGDEIEISDTQSETIRVRVVAKSISPLDEVELVSNGKVIHRWQIDGAGPEWQLETELALPGGGWIAARATGPQHRYVGDAFAFAHTSPVYLRSQEQHAVVADARFLMSAVDEVWRRAKSRNSWLTEQQRETFHEYIRNARAYYSSIVLEQPQDAGMQARAPDQFKVVMLTTRGEILVDMRRDWAPHGVDRFYNLVRNAYYDDARFFRVREADFAQFGVNASPKLATAWRNQRIPDDPVVESNLRGTIAFAMGLEPNDRTTQVYINLKDKPELDAMGFAVMGKVISGMDAADALYSGYGESAGGGIRNGKQDVLFEGGNHYLSENFPQLDGIIEAYIIEE